MSNYNGIFVRSALGQDNTIPRQGQQTLSPDIMQMGTVPVADPQSLFTNGYDVYFENALTAQQVNYIYLRGKNYAAQPINDTGDTRPRLFAAKASLLLWPQTWTELTTCSSNEDLALKADAGTVGVANRPFVWQPAVITNDHYCLISIVPSPGYDNNIPDGPISDFNAWVAAHGGIGCQSVSLVNSGTLTISGQTQFRMTPEGGLVMFLLNCKNLPSGCQVSFSGGSPGTSPALYMPPTTVTNAVSFSAGIQCSVPGNYVTDIYFNIIVPNGINIPAEASVSMDAYLVANPGALLKGVDQLTVLASKNFLF